MGEAMSRLDDQRLAAALALLESNLDGLRGQVEYMGTDRRRHIRFDAMRTGRKGVNHQTSGQEDKTIRF